MRRPAILLPFIVLPVATAAAQTPPPAAAAAPADSFTDVYAVIAEASDQPEAVNLWAIARAQRAIAADPALSRIDDEQPGLTTDLAEALGPVTARIARRLSDTYQPRMIAAVRETFTPAEAADIAAFFRSTTGRKLVGGFTAAYQSKAIITAALRLGMVTPDDAKSGAEDAARDAFSALTPEDYERIGQEAETRPALQKINLLTQRLGALRLAMEEEPPLPAEKTEMQAAIKAGVAAHAARFAK